jgi:hypothetical protein
VGPLQGGWGAASPRQRAASTESPEREREGAPMQEREGHRCERGRSTGGAWPCLGGQAAGGALGGKERSSGVTVWGKRRNEPFFLTSGSGG